MWWETLTARVRTLITLAFLVLLLIGGMAWGWSQVSEPFPGKVDVPDCVETSYEAGASLSVQEVTISVINASSREGLAARTLQQLEDVGFDGGRISNAPTGVTVSAPAEIWVSSEGNPAAKLLRKYVGKVPVRTDMTSPLPGITLVVGDTFGELLEGPTALTVDEAATVCSPPVS